MAPHPALSTTSQRDIAWVCERLSLQVSRLFDQCDFAGAAMLFTQDCEFVRPSTYPHGALRGRQAIREIGLALPPSMRSGSQHVCSNFIVDALSDTEAVCTSLFMRFGDHRQLSERTTALPVHDHLRSVGAYDETMRLTSEGWRIHARIGRFTHGSV